MRKELIAALLCLTAISTAFLVSVDGTAVAQSGQKQKNKDKEHPPPPPPRRCPDLALSTYRYVSEVPGGAPLAANEVALQFTVQNAGSAPYSASSASMQSIMLEYTSPAGLQQIATTTLPQVSGDAASAPVALGQYQFWRGYLRATLSPEARRRPWRLRIAYNGDRYAPINDCDPSNNEVGISQPPATAPAAATTGPATATTPGTTPSGG
jgi:hypothetical protein